MRLYTLLASAALVLLGAAPTFAADSHPQLDKMSPAGKRAAAAIARIRAATTRHPPTVTARALAANDDDNCLNKPECGAEDESAADIPGGQAEVSIAVDHSGQHIVV